MEILWKDVLGYEGLYKVSNDGRIYGVRLKHELKLRNHNSGYKTIMLYKNNISKQYTVHRLVAEAFIPNPNNLRDVNHKDENKTNNRVDNLEWCSHKYNCNYGKRNDNLKTRIKCIETNIIHNSVKEASEFYNISSCAISNNLRGVSKSTHNLHFIRI